MRKIEIIFGIIAFLGVLMKLFHYPGGSLFLIFALGIITNFLFYFGFALFNRIRFRDIFKNSSYKDASAKKIIGAIGLGWGLSMIVLGGLFKLVLYPNPDKMLLVGLLYTGVILIVAIVYYLRNKSDYYKRIFKRIAIYGIFGLVLYLIPTTTFLNIYFAKNPEYSEHPEFAELFQKVLAEPENFQKYSGQLEQLRMELEWEKIQKWQQEKDKENNRSR